MTEQELSEISAWNNGGQYSGRPGEVQRDIGLLVAEVRKLRGIYESAVKGRADFRTAFREQRALVAEARKIIEGLGCPGCEAQGAEMAGPGKCCRDADCDAGWYGIHCDEVAAFLAKPAAEDTPLQGDESPAVDKAMDRFHAKCAELDANPI